jgi:hypothetical protein
MNWIHLAQDAGPVKGCCEHFNRHWVTLVGELLTSLRLLASQLVFYSIQLATSVVLLKMKPNMCSTDVNGNKCFVFNSSTIFTEVLSLQITLKVHTL